MSPAIGFLAGAAAFAVTAAFAYLRPAGAGARNLQARRVMVAAAAAAGALAEGAPTDLDAWNVALRAGLAGFVTWMAGRASLSWLALAALPLSFNPFGAAALGMATAPMLVLRRRTPVLGCGAGALLTAAALRLGAGPFHGSTALLAGTVLAAVILDGHRRLSSDRRVVVGRWLLGLAGAAAVATLLAGVGAATIARRADLASEAAAAGLEAARRGETERASEQFEAAAAGFAAVRDRVETPLFLPGRLVPVVSQHVAVVNRAARAGHEASRSGARTAGLARAEELRFADGRLDLQRVRDLAEPLADTRSALSAARRDLRRAASPWLLDPISSRLVRESARVEDAARDTEIAAHVVRTLPALLGGDGPRRYFLAVQQPAELRGSGGIIGNFGEVAAIDGRLDVVRFGRDAEVNAAAEASGATLAGAPADYVARYDRFRPARLWQNVTVSPDFPTVARVVRALYPQSGGDEVDGVIGADPTALAALLRLTGPITVAPWPEPISADNVERILHLEQYLRLAGPPRERFLGDVAEAVTRRLTTGTLPPARELARVLGGAVRGGHLVLSSFDDDEQALFDRIGVSGRLANSSSDTLAVINQNAGGNKLDQFLRRSYRYEVDVDDTGAVTATLTLTLRNETPATGLNDYVAGNFVGDPPGTNRTYLSVYTPWALRSASLGGEPLTVESARELGRRVYSTFVIVPAGEERTLEFRLAGELDSPYRLALHHQPLIVPDEVEVDLPAGRRRFVLRSRAAVG